MFFDIANMKDHTCGMHCSCWYFLGALLWIASIFSLVCAWIAGEGGATLGIASGTWYANALIFGVLAIPLKLKKHAAGCDCATCGK